MSELIITNKQNGLRRQLLATASAGSLLLAASAAETAAIAQNSDRPTVWIELGGQLETVYGEEYPYEASFISRNFAEHQNDVSPLSAQKQPRFSFGGEGRLSFQPSGSDWVFSAAVHYGRSNGKRSVHQQTETNFPVRTAKYATKHGLGNLTEYRFNNSQVKYSTSHTIVDFTAGRDVGLGMFGRTSSSTISAGIRIAQFNVASDIVFRSLPGNVAQPDLIVHPSHQNHHTYYAHAQIARTFRGVGPIISWDGSTPIAGSRDTGEMTLDWGANAAALFGRQKVQGSHQTTGKFFTGPSGVAQAYPVTHYVHNVPMDRSRSVIVPNLGGFAGISVKYPNAKFSLGYRADFFFNAMDEGIDTRDSGIMGFHGPFATFAVGLGG